ncbi:general secretion pathway protein GspD [Photobacterium proteolyticum]|uniref:General secretion pathway protein GspD n=2 Tax=Photobacterium proteolyticum TaxID=1903952 RepID=A0A1Q9H1K4_9GAMM|nr:general secretion pathway protein GspD [Photobacterium proteolyticum]
MIKILLNTILILFIVGSGMANAALLNLDKGAAKTIKTTNKIDTVFISDTDIADYKVIDDQRVVVFGIDVGMATVIIYDRQGNEIYNRELIVNRSLLMVKQLVMARYPDEQVTIKNIGQQVVLDGIVSSEVVKNEIYQLVGELLKKDKTTRTISQKSGDGYESAALEYTASHQYAGIIDNLKVLATNQINVKLTVAEVSSSFLSKLGISYGSEGSDSGTFVDYLYSFSAEDIVSVISAKEDEKLGQILAEPNLSVISGETASFLVGGEIPIAVRDGDSVSISYKEYGIKLSIVAKVTDSENIRLSLMPEVSSIDSTVSYSDSFVTVPSLKTRKAHTTVQLTDGQSFVLAGLLTSEERELLSRVPVLGDIPVLGSLFRHTESDYLQTELIIVATVNLVEPVSAKQVKLPYMERTSVFERLLGVELSRKHSASLNEILSEGGFQ